tara:strand:+ start:143 stop:475 length:333 start_codon:yes stop_codon:yes gene_type:complete
MKVLLILLLLVPTLAMSKVYKKNGKFTLKTSSKSGFKYHRNYMDHNNYNFQYIKDKKKHELESTISNLSFEMVIALEMIIGLIVILTEKELNFQQGLGNLLQKINVLDIV